MIEEAMLGMLRSAYGSCALGVLLCKGMIPRAKALGNRDAWMSSRTNGNGICYLQYSKVLLRPYDDMI